MPPDRFLEDMTANQPPDDGDTQQLIEAESGRGIQGINRRWQASDSARVVLTSDSTGVKISDNNGTAAPTHVIVDGSTAGGHLTGTYPDPTVSAAGMNALIPPGTIWGFARDIPPAGWALCNGQEVSRAANPILFATISTFYGIGNGSTTFNVPNLVGRFLLMVSPLHGLATGGGFEDAAGPLHTHPGAHAHGMNGHTHPQTSHTHTPGSHVHGLGHDHPITHDHSLNGHAHDVDIDHDHPNAAAAAGASASTLNGRFTLGGVNALPDTHTHPVDIPSLTLTLKRSAGPAAPTTNTGGTTTPNTGAVSTPNTGAPSASDTGGASATSTGIPSNPNTEDASPAHAASYGAVRVPTMPPYLTAAFIIRLG